MAKLFNDKNLNFLVCRLILILGVLLLTNGIIAMPLSGMSLGVILTYAFAFIFILGGVCIKYQKNRLLVSAIYFALFLFLLILIYSGFVYLYGGNDTVTYEEDAVIVLGTTVLGDEPSEDLKVRLDQAVEYSKKNPDALIIVTGGQSTEENKSEAYVMNKYLSYEGIDKEKIIMEDRATNTVENFEYSLEILNSELGENYQVAYITNDFHIFRAGILAKDAGITHATHYHGDTPWYMVIPNGLRETIVTIKMWLID